MKQQPLISICIANYNGKDVIDDCIQSILQQTGDLNIEIIVHDDASTDGSAAHIKNTYPDIHTIECVQNVGFCIANNRMASRAQGKYLLLLNNDASLFKDALITLYQAAIEIKQPAILSLPQYNSSTGELIDTGCLLDPFLNPVPNLDQQRSDVAMVIGACMWVPMELWNDLGGFPEWFGSIGEDLYLCCLARLTGYPVKVVGSSGYYHHVGQSFGGGKTEQGKLITTFRRRALSETNKTFVMVIVYPSPIIQLILPIHLLLLLAEGLLLTATRIDRRYLTQIYLPVFQRLFHNRAKLMEKRRTTICRRAKSISSFFSVFSMNPYKLKMLLKHGFPYVK